MRLSLTLTAVFITAFVFGQGLQPDTSLAMKKLKSSAENMRQSLVDNDFAKFADFVYPAIIKMAGGKDKMIELTKKSFADLEGQGFKISDVTINDPSTIFTSTNRLQSMIQENLTIQTKGGHLNAKSYLIAISENGGKTWYFMDTSGKSLEQMKATFPFLSAKLVLPKKEQPLFYKD